MKAKVKQTLKMKILRKWKNRRERKKKNWKKSKEKKKTFPLSRLKSQSLLSRTTKKIYN